MLLAGAFWGSLAALAWTHVGYPLAAGLLAGVRGRKVAKADTQPSVALIVAAHDEEAVIGERVENALRLDYPRERLEIVVALDGSSDGTRQIVERFASEGVRLLDLPRAGKLTAQNEAAATTTADVLAFSDANSLWEPDALRHLVRNLADTDVGYVCGQLRLDDADNGGSREGLYWRYELWLREKESACGSITAGNGAIYAVRRSEFLELADGHSHDLGLPFRLRRRGLRSVYEPAAIAREPTLATTSAERRRKVRMLSQAWWEILHGGMLDPRGQPPLYFAALVSHRGIRYASGPLHLIALLTGLTLASHDRRVRALLALQLGLGALALVGRRRPELPLAGAAWYYVAVTAASAEGLVRALGGPQGTWAPSRRGS
ncbi:MAG TPA: glycosyltransferase family 2 protein [Gaiellaceae bacterium]|nr:glycosyltransferase family 2 protein [Gaiellaceae bacterium]